MPKWDKLLMQPHYLSRACKEAAWPPDKGNGSREFTDEEVAEMEAKGIRVKRASKR